MLCYVTLRYVCHVMSYIVSMCIVEIQEMDIITISKTTDDKRNKANEDQDIFVMALKFLNGSIKNCFKFS